ncbi:MAG: DNA cytosine methyltransferase [Clostridia bacterium]|nr:DNA cytosine methyltransferase [Clostridia bacterium]
MNGLSLFSSAGIAETYFKENNIDIVVASELVEKRCAVHSWIYKDCEMICGDITDSVVFNKVKNAAVKQKCKFLLATPPCQGMSSLGKKEYTNDTRNYLIFYVLDIIDACDFDYILIENVPKFLSMHFPYNGEIVPLLNIINEKYSKSYNIESFILNAKDYGVPQSRPRSFIKIWKKGLKWSNPTPQKEITLREAIGGLPSLEPGEYSNIKWHYAKNHNARDVDAMRHTPEGKSAFLNTVHFPKKQNGERMKGFHNTFARMRWNEPCPARAMQSGNIGGHNNVHPGRPLTNGTYSDPRVLTLRELFIVSSLPPDLDLPDWCTDTFIRQIIGEAIPPRLSESIIKGVGK